jgi:hypothetical protein
MPDLDLPDFHLPEAGPYIFAVMLNPAKPDEHRRFVDAVRNTATLNIVGRADPSQLRPSAAPEVARAALGPKLTDVGREYARHLVSSGYVRGDMAGRLLIFVLSCVEHEPDNASMERTYDAFKEAHNNRIKGFSRAQLAKIWSEFKSVSHLWATLLVKRPLWEEAGRTGNGSKLADFLSYAEALRTTAEAHRPANSPPILEPDEAWRVPSRFVLPRSQIAFPNPDMLRQSMLAWHDESTAL